MYVARMKTFLGAATLIASLAVSNIRAADPEARNDDSATSSGRVAWMPNLAQARRNSAATGKPILIIFGAKWCGFCRKLENNLSDPELSEYINANFIPVHLDLDRDKKAARFFQVSKLPATLVLGPDRKVLARFTGYRDIDEFYDELEDSLARDVNGAMGK